MLRKLVARPPGGSIAGRSPNGETPWHATDVSVVAVSPRNGELLGLLDESGRPEDRFGTRVVSVAGRAARPTSLSMHLSAEVVVADSDGNELITVRTGTSPLGSAGGTVLDLRRTLVMPQLSAEAPSAPFMLKTWVGKRFVLECFYHPYVCLLRKQLNQFGLDGVFDPSPQGPARG